MLCVWMLCLITAVRFEAQFLFVWNELTFTTSIGIGTGVMQRTDALYARYIANSSYRVETWDELRIIDRLTTY